MWSGIQGSYWDSNRNSKGHQQEYNVGSVNKYLIQSSIFFAETAWILETKGILREGREACQSRHGGGEITVRRRNHLFQRIDYERRSFDVLMF